MDVHRSAQFSACGRYRYRLERRWRDGGETVLFVGLNPSTAGEAEDDATVRRCMGFACDWGYSHLIVCNLFGYRATRPGDLFISSDPTGPNNDHALRHAIQRADRVIVAWGNHGRFANQDRRVLGWISDPYTLRLNTGGQPAHPLYLPKRLTPIPFSPA
jgi:hypothetical protein